MASSSDHLPLRIALVHKWFSPRSVGGAEQVVQEVDSLPLLPFAIDQIELGAAELVISSSHLVAKGVLTSPDQLHISYVHTPVRYAWDQMHAYLQRSALARRGLGL